MTAPLGSAPIRSPSQPTIGRALGKLALLTAGLVAAGVLARGLGAAPGTTWFDAHLRGPFGWALFLAGGAAATALGVPRQGVAFLGGYGFGAASGIGLALAAQVLGGGAAFLWARAVGGAVAERVLEGRFGARLRPLADALRAAPFGATLALRLLPVGSNLALNLLAGVVRLRLAPFLTASALGYLPQTVVFALLGKGVRVEGGWQLGMAATLMAISLGLGLWLLRRHRAARALG